MKITVELLDGNTLVCEADQKTWMCLADRIAFKEQFGIAPTAMSLWGRAFEENDEGERELSTDADPNLLAQMDEAYLLFFAWREMQRRLDRKQVPAFKSLMANVAGMELDGGDEGEADPT